VTDRVDVEFKNMFETKGLMERGWVEAILWSSNENPTKDSVRLAAQLAAHRTIYQLHHQNCEVESLGDMLDQESWVWQQIGIDLCPESATNGVERSIKVLKQHQTAVKSDSYPTIIAAYFGDDAAEERGFPTVSLHGWSGRDICRNGLWN
jgi:hypothetical protein